MLYFENGEIAAESGDVKVYKMNDTLYLEIGPGHNLWIDSTEEFLLRSQINSLPKGNCLELGLGLGLASKYILNRPEVTHLTTVEINPDIINVYNKMNKVVDLQHTIILADSTEYLIYANEMFDFIFMDHYDLIDEDTLDTIQLDVKLAKEHLLPGGIIIGWFDPSTPSDLAEKFFDLFESKRIEDKSWLNKKE